MKNYFIASVIFAVVILFSDHSSTAENDKAGLKKSNSKCQTVTVSSKILISISPVFNQCDTKKKISKPRMKNPLKKPFFKLKKKVLIENNRRYRTPRLMVRKDIDYKILRMQVRKDIDFKINSIR